MASRLGWWAAACAIWFWAANRRTTTSPPTPARSSCSGFFRKAQLVGAQFGVVLVDGVEVATFRSDHSLCRTAAIPGESRLKPIARQDVLRRDFTINALLLDPAILMPSIPRSHVVDYVGGLADLRARRHPRHRRSGTAFRRRSSADAARDSFRRALRFRDRAGHAGARFRSCTQQILRVSPERIRDELIRILTEGGARRGFELLDDSGLLGRYLARDRRDERRRSSRREFHPEGDVWTHTLIMLEGLRSPTPTLALGSAAARCRQARHVSHGRPHPLRRPCGAGRADRRARF